MLTNPDDVYKRTMNKEVIDQDKALIRKTFLEEAAKLTRHEYTFTMPTHGFRPKLVYKYTDEVARECNKEGKTYYYRVRYDMENRTQVELCRHFTKWEQFVVTYVCMMITLTVVTMNIR